jgi:glutaryl-CoA dehydrogenase
MRDPFAHLPGLDDFGTLDDDGARVVLDLDDTPLEVVPAEEDATADVEQMAGWAEALDAPARQLRAAVLEIVREQWMPRAAADTLQGRFPREVFGALGRAGAIGAGLVGRRGEPPMSRAATCAVMHATEYGDGGLRCALTIQDSVIQALVRFGDDEQRARWLAPLTAGERIASFALTEPEAGSDVRAVATRATRRDGGWVLRGQKGWITNAQVADVLLVWARTGEGNDAIRGFLVERGAPGLDIQPLHHAVGMRAAGLGRVTLDGVRVAGDSLLPHAWGLTDVNACLDYNRLTVVFGVMGAARFCLEAAVRHARQRQQFGVPIGSKQLVQAELADMATQVVVGEILSLHVARRWEQAPPARFEVSLAKRSNCRAALQVARQARAVLGAAGLTLDTHVARHLLNLEASFTYGGTHEIHSLVLGRVLTHENAF